MKTLELIKRRPLIGLMALAMTLAAVVIILFFRAGDTSAVDSYNACATAGYAITDSNPAVCQIGNDYMTGPVTSVAPASSSTVGGVSQPFTLLAAADTGTSTPRQSVVVHDAASYAAWWAKIHAGLLQPTLIPVDFTQDDVIFIIEGPEVTTGYNYEVTGVESNAVTSVVYTSETVPTLGCPVANRQSNRYYVASTPKLSGNVAFVNTVTARHCP